LTNETFEKIKEQVQKDLHFDESSVLTKMLTVPKLMIRYNIIFQKQYEHCKLLLIKKDELYGKLYEQYKYSGKYALSTKGEVEAFVFSDDKWIELSRNVVEQDSYLKFMENVISDIKQLNYVFRNFVEYKKYLEGLI
jgi:hypothetical protein